jgi:hypothetical protein
MPFALYYQADQRKEDVMGGTCSMGKLEIYEQLDGYISRESFAWKT